MRSGCDTDDAKQEDQKATVRRCLEKPETAGLNNGLLIVKRMTSTELSKSELK